VNDLLHGMIKTIYLLKIHFYQVRHTVIYPYHMFRQNKHKLIPNLISFLDLKKECINNLI